MSHIDQHGTGPYQQNGTGLYFQSESTNDSRRWIQQIVNGAPQLLSEQLGIGKIDWLSPTAADNYARYRDLSVIERLGITLQCRPLEVFWPKGGPQWDALGLTGSGEIVLVDSKAHLNDLYAPNAPSPESSLKQVQLALRETARGLGVPDGFDWSKHFYQYASRLAHAYFLHVINGIRTRLVLVYFTSDKGDPGPSSLTEWNGAISLVQDALGLTSAPDFVVDAFIDTREQFRSSKQPTVSVN